MQPGLYGLKLSSSVCAPVSPRAASQDYSNHRIRRIDIATGSTTTLAGTSSSGSTNGAGASSQFNYPYGVAIDPSGSFALVAVRQLPVAPLCTNKHIRLPLHTLSSSQCVYLPPTPMRHRRTI